MLNVIPVVGWIINLLLVMSLSVPFWLIWTVFDFGERYFYFVPETYHSLPFWHCVGLITVIGILKLVLVPKFTYPNISNSSKG